VNTVGFIRKLPPSCRKFKSTLDEVRESDILLHVVDTSHARYEEQIGIVNKTLQEINAYDKPVITVFNKMDLYETNTFDPWLEEEVRAEIVKELKERWKNELQGNCVFVAATEKRNIDELRSVILNKVKELYRVRYPYKTEYLF